MTRTWPFFTLMLVALAATAAFSAPAPVDDSQRYAGCLALAGRDPARAIKAAEDWRASGAGAPASHCLAMAHLAAGHFLRAARELEALAEAGGASALMRADVLAQAGEAWLGGGKPNKAYLDFSAALSETPTGVPARFARYIDRARALADLRDYTAALADLEQARAIDPGRAQTYVFMASAWRALGELGPAAKAVAKALAIDPKNVDALLERGNIRRLEGNDKGAKRDWQALLALAPEGPAAEAARVNLAVLAHPTPPHPIQP
jgi:tetratricopeptide (TPR) repeat protein